MGYLGADKIEELEAENEALKKNLKATEKAGEEIRKLNEKLIARVKLLELQAADREEKLTSARGISQDYRDERMIRALTARLTCCACGAFIASVVCTICSPPRGVY